MKAAADKETVYQKFTGDSYVVEVEKIFFEIKNARQQIVPACML
jgi:hypothetical protein